MRLAMRIEHRDGAVLDPDGHGPLEQLLDFGRRRCRREIEVVILDAKEIVADRPTHAPRLEPRILQPPRDFHDFRGDVKLSHRGRSLR